MGLSRLRRRFEEVGKRPALEGRLGDQAGDGLQAEPGWHPQVNRS